MRRLSIQQVVPGMTLAMPIYSTKGAVLLQSKTVMTDAYISLLHRRGFQSLWVEDPDTADVVLEPALSEETRAVANSSNTPFYDLADNVGRAIGPAQSSIAKSYLNSGEFRRLTSVLPNEELNQAVQLLVSEAAPASPASTIIQSLKSVENYLFCHAIDTAVVAVMIGARVGLPLNQLQRLARGSLLHDLGMALLPGSLREKPGPLTEEEQLLLRHHPSIGYQLLSALRPDDVLANHIAFQHHERQDGTGYPRGLRGTNSIRRPPHEQGGMLLLAEIGAVASIYDALSADRSFRTALPPDKVWQTIQSLAGTQLNKEVVEAFLSILPPYPLSTDVVVVKGSAAGYAGVVVALNPEAMHRPTVRLLSDPSGQRTMPIDLNLAEEPDVEIASRYHAE